MRGINRLLNQCFVKINQLLKLGALRIFYRLRIMSPEQTIQYIQNNQCSISRYGDGEFDLMLKLGSIGFQDESVQLAHKLEEVLSYNDEKLLLCIPWSFNHLRYRSKSSKHWWRWWALNNNKQIKVTKKIWELTGRNYLFGDAQITRPYIAMKSAARGDILFPMLKKLWKDRNVLIVEGEYTRLGVGNDLLANTTSIARILCPAKNAFDCYDNILQQVCGNYQQDQLVVLALGPTATVLAADLCKLGIQALDIGHIDVEYEWYLNGSKDRIALTGKYTNEAANGKCVDDCVDPDYLKQIKVKIINE